MRKQGSTKVVVVVVVDVVFNERHLRIYVKRFWSKDLEENTLKPQVINIEAWHVCSDIIYCKGITECIPLFSRVEKICMQL